MPETTTTTPHVRAFTKAEEGFSWDGVDKLVYKPVGTHFRDITRQVLFDGDEAAGAQLRYFEIGPDGHSTFERHEHVHAVMILRGRGRVLIGDAVTPVAAFDLVRVPPMTWHQFRADADAPLGFLCLVACERDRPQRPTEEQIEELRSDPALAGFIRL